MASMTRSAGVNDNWAANRAGSGWRYGEQRDDAAGTHPDMLAWDDLPEPRREIDRMLVRALPELLAANGLGIAIIDVTCWAAVDMPAESLRGIYEHLSTALRNVPEAVTFVLVPPSIQGIGNSGGFTMQLELRDGSLDFDKLQAAATGSGTPLAQVKIRPPLPKPGQPPAGPFGSQPPLEFSLMA